MQSTNLVTAANIDHMKCHINSMIGFPEVGATYLQIEQAMSMFDYESEDIETVVFAWIRDRRDVLIEMPSGKLFILPR